MTVRKQLEAEKVRKSLEKGFLHDVFMTQQNSLFIRWIYEEEINKRERLHTAVNLLNELRDLIYAESRKYGAGDDTNRE